MKIGRKPKPVALKLLEGNPGRRPLSKNEPEFDRARPTPPQFLSDDAKQEWDRMIDILFESGVMTESDRAAFAAYCQSYGRWAQAERQLAKLQEKNELNGLLINRLSFVVIDTSTRPCVKYAAQACTVCRFFRRLGQ